MDKIIERIAFVCKDNSKILLLGSGGGSDIFSCLLVADILKANIPNIQIDLAGMLSPAAIHYYKDKFRNNTRERPLNYFNKDTLMTRKLEDVSQSQVSFIDKKLWDAIAHMGLEDVVGQTFHLSCRFGTKRVGMAFKDACAANGYKMVLAVDVGGDIIQSLRSGGTLSPIMDWTALNILGSAKIYSCILEFGFGVDGESMGKIDLDIRKQATLGDISKCDKSISKFSSMFNEVMKPIRSGHTIPLFLEGLKPENKNIGIFTYPHSYAYRIGGETVFKDDFERSVDHHPSEAFLWEYRVFIRGRDDYYHFRSGYCVEEKAFDYESPIDYMLDLKELNPYIATEMDGHVCKIGECDGRRCLNALISKRIKNEDRIKYINMAIEFVRERNEGLLMFKSDIPLTIVDKDECALMEQVRKNVVYLPPGLYEDHPVKFGVKNDD